MGMNTEGLASGVKQGFVEELISSLTSQVLSSKKAIKKQGFPW